MACADELFGTRSTETQELLCTPRTSTGIDAEMNADREGVRRTSGRLPGAITCTLLGTRVLLAPYGPIDADLPVLGCDRVRLRHHPPNQGRRRHDSAGVPGTA